MSIDQALAALYGERDRLDADRAKVERAIAALEPTKSRATATSKPKPKAKQTPTRAKKKDGRSAPKPVLGCPFCDAKAKGMAGVAAHVRRAHPTKYPDAYRAWRDAQKK